MLLCCDNQIECMTILMCWYCYVLDKLMLIKDGLKQHGEQVSGDVDMDV